LLGGTGILGGPLFDGKQENMLKPDEVLEKDYLDTRCMLLDIAATLDRLDAAAQRQQVPVPKGDRRLKEIYQSLQLLAEQDTTADRAERLLNLFSDLD
jgi:hypothetical protein